MRGTFMFVAPAATSKMISFTRRRIEALVECYLLVDMILLSARRRHTSSSILLQRRDGRLRRISDLHSAYAALHYVLPFPHGEDVRNSVPKETTSGKLLIHRPPEWSLAPCRSLHCFKNSFLGSRGEQSSASARLARNRQLAI